ncbi:MAG: hypothetical protein OXG64_07390 [Chloroflexi bacterium]|nr:hypothetical protein [Chloroflexota bacterium]
MPRLVRRTVVICMFTASLALAFEPVVDRRLPWLNLDAELTLANFVCGALWCAVAVLAGRLARRRRRLGWLSVAILAGTVAILEVYDVKEGLGPWGASSWMLISAPATVPMLVLASRTLVVEASSVTHRTLLGLAGIFAVAGLWLDAFDQPIAIGEEGSELLAAAVLIALFLSLLDEVPLAPTVVVRPLVVATVLVTIGGVGFLAMREYWTPISSATVRRCDVDHGPLAVVAQGVTINRPNLGRIDVCVESSGGPADLWLSVGQPGQPPIRESRTTTSHVRWSSGTVTFTFDAIPDSQGQTYEIAIGALHRTPYLFLGLASGDPLAGGVAHINGRPDPWANDLALRAYAKHRLLDRLRALLTDRSAIDRLIIVELLVAWLWVVAMLVWLAAWPVDSERRHRLRAS